MGTFPGPRLSGLRHPGAAAPRLVLLLQQEQELGLGLDVPELRGPPGLGDGTGAEGAAGGRGAPQLPLAARWREQQTAGQVQEGKLLKLLQVRYLGCYLLTPTSGFFSLWAACSGTSLRLHGMPSYHPAPSA